MYLLRSILFFLITSVAHAELKWIKPALQIRAAYPYEWVDPRVYYDILHGNEDLQKRCILVHGHGLTQGNIDFLIKHQGAGAQLARILTLGKSEPQVYAEAAFGGGPFIERLRQNLCHDVVVVMQESTQSSVWEMTQRLEALTSEMCHRQLPEGMECALIAHSKGGVAASLLVQRCRDQTSPDEKACRSLTELYTMGAAREALGLMYVLLGSTIDIPQRFFDALRAPVRPAPIFDESQLFQLPNMTWSVVFDTQSPYIKNQTNPLWFDLSPLSLVDRDRPLHQILRDLSKGGWWEGRYAAVGTGHDFSTGTKIGSGTPLARDFSHLGKPRTELMRAIRDMQEAPTLQESFAKSFTESLSQALKVLHSEDLRPSFERGKSLSLAMSNDPVLRQRMSAFTWEDFQRSDGFVDTDASLGLCRASRPQKPSHCLELRSVNHFSLSGFAAEVYQHLVQVWSE